LRAEAILAYTLEYASKTFYVAAPDPAGGAAGGATGGAEASVSAVEVSIEVEAETAIGGYLDSIKFEPAGIKTSTKTMEIGGGTRAKATY
jgi:hypothetical protein